MSSTSHVLDESAAPRCHDCAHNVAFTGSVRNVVNPENGQACECQTRNRALDAVDKTERCESSGGFRYVKRFDGKWPIAQKQDWLRLHQGTSTWKVLT
jgi:hypothetical protein